MQRVTKHKRVALRENEKPRFLGAFIDSAFPCGQADLGKMATLVGLEPMTSAVTGRRSNQLSYSAIGPTPIIGNRIGLHLSVMVGTVGIEPTTSRV